MCNNYVKDILVLYHEIGNKKIQNGLHSWIWIKPIKLLSYEFRSSCAKVQNIFVPCKYSLKKPAEAGLRIE